VLELAGHGLVAAVRRNGPLARGVNVWRGHLVHPAVAEALGATATPLEKLLGERAG
jgi:alanine dehydrogenase